MANEYYDHTTFPATGSIGSSASLRAELDAIEVGFDKLPALLGKEDELVVVNGTGTGMTTTTNPTLSGLTVSGNIYGTALLGKDASSVVAVRPTTADGSDNQYANLSGGGATANATRGAYVTAFGNENAAAGALYLSSGTGGDILLRVGGVTTMTISGATGYVKHAYAGLAGTPVYCLANTTDTGLYGSTNSVGIAAAGVQAARFYDGYASVGSGGASPNVFMYNYGTLSQSASATLQGYYQRVSFPVATGNGTTFVSQMHLGNTLDINDAGGALTIASVYGFNANSPVINSVNGATVITNFYQFRAADLTDTKVATAFGYWSAVNALAGTTRWQYYGAGSAPSYDGGDRHIAGNRFDKQAAPVAYNTAQTLSTAALLSRMLSSVPAAPIDLTLPDGTTLDAAITQMAVNFSFDWTVINTSAFVVSIASPGASHTVVGNLTAGKHAIAANSSATFRTRKSSANTFITYRIS